MTINNDNPLLLLSLSVYFHILLKCPYSFYVCCRSNLTIDAETEISSKQKVELQYEVIE